MMNTNTHSYNSMNTTYEPQQVSRTEIGKEILGTPDFMELLLAHMIRDKEVFRKAKQIGLVPADFATSDEYSFQLYKVFAEICMEIGDSPIGHRLMGIKIKEKIASYDIPETLIDMAGELWDGLYKIELNSSFVSDNIQPFIKRQRQYKIKSSYGEDPDKLLAELSKLSIEISNNEEDTDVVVYEPLKELVYKESITTIPTGLRKIDEIGGGLALGKFGMIVSTSGGYKTGTGVNFAYKSAYDGLNTVYVSGEEPGYDIAQRFNARMFGINYSALYRGNCKEQLTEAWKNRGESVRRAADHFKILDFHSKRFTVNDIIKYLMKFAANGFVTQQVIIDQLEFMDPLESFKNDNGTAILKRIGCECDQLISHRPIHGVTPAVWLMHQLKGAPRLNFTTEDLSMCKSLQNPCDVMLAIGNDPKSPDEILISSLKSRHCPAFSFMYKAIKEFMRIEEKSASPRDHMAKNKGNM